MASSIALLLILCAASAVAQSGSISGVVVKSPSGEGAGGATVKIMTQPPGVALPPAQSQLTTTAASDGSFHFDDVAPGTYWIVANLTGYLPTEYGQRNPTGTGISFDVEAGSRVTMRLTAWPTAGISGRVVNADGDPVGRAQVLALRTIYRDGQPASTIVQTVMTNDRGEYRMFWLAPGSYRVAARAWDPATSATASNIAPPRRFTENEQATGPIISRRKTTAGAEVEEIDLPVYSPSVTDLRLAATLALEPGDNATNIDIQFAGNRVPARHVRGVIVRPGDAGRNPTVRVVPRSALPFAVVPSGVAKADGSFDIAGVAPGSYIVYSGDRTPPQPIEITDTDVDVTLASQPPISLKGRLTFDTGIAGTTAGIDISDFQVVLTPEPNLLGASSAGARFNPPPSDDGTLTLSDIAPDDYRVDIRPFMGRDDPMSARALAGPLKSAYVKSIRFGDVDVLAEGLHLSGPTQSSLDIVIGVNGADVEGSASDGRDPVANVTIVAVPEPASHGRGDLYRRAVTDRRGRFALQGVAPGDYTFYAFDAVERGAWESQEFLRSVEGRGRFARLREGRNDPIELNVITPR